MVSCGQQQTDSPVHFPVSEKGYDPTAPQPRIKLSDTLVNLGTINPDTVYKIPIVVANVGEEPLIIRRAFSDCGCVVSQIPQDPIKPNDQDTLIITLNTKEIPEGATSRIVTVVSNSIPNYARVTILFQISR